MPWRSSPQPPDRIGEREFMALMAMIMALQAAMIDGMLPALGLIAGDLGSTDPNQRQLVVGVFVFGSGFGALFPGALADRFGRRRVLMGSFACYIVLTLACALVRDFTTLLVLRALQGFTCAGLPVLPSTIIRDRFGGDRMARMMSMISVIFMAVPMVAPSFGQAVMLVAGWRWIFGSFAVMALAVAIWAWLRLPETLHPEYRQPIKPRVILANMREAATTRSAIGYVVGSALLSGAMFAYINSSQQLIAERFGAGEAFPLIFASLAGGLAIANFSNSRIVERFGARRLSHTALLAYIALAALQVWRAWQGDETLWEFVPLMALNLCLMGFVFANFGSIAMQPFARIAGAASSFQACTRMITGAVAGGLVGQAYNGTPLPLTLAMLVFGTVSLLLVLYSENGRLFRRLNPPGAPRPVPPAAGQ